MFVQRIAEDPVAIRAKWVEDVQLFLDEGKLGGQILDFDRLRDRTIQNKWFADSEWALMVMGVAQQLEAKARDGVAVPNDAFMNIMVRQIDVKYRPELTDVQKQLKKQKVRGAATPTRARKNQLKAIWKDPAQMAGYNFAALTDAELAYFVRQVNKKTVREAQPVWKAATGAGNTPGDTHIPVVCYFLWNAVGGAGRVQQDVDDANTIYNRKRIFIQPVFIRQLTRADVEAALGHQLDDRFFLDFRGVDSGADEHTHGGGKKKKPKFTDSDTEKIVKRYIPQNVVGGLWVGDMVADAGRSPGKSNDASEKWLVVNTAPAVNRTIFAHELGHLAFDSAHPVQQEEDQVGQQFTQDLPVDPATLTDDRLSLHLKYNVLTSGGLMDQFWSFAPPTPADVHVSPGQADKAKASPLAFVNP